MYAIISKWGHILVGNLKTLKEAQQELNYITTKEDAYKKDELEIIKIKEG